MENVDKLKGLLADVSTDLTFYNQIFGASENVETLREFSDWVFSNYKKCLTDTIFSKLSKLLDPEKTCGSNNLSFRYVIESYSLSNDEEISDFINQINDIYKSSGLKNYRNKVLAHNDALSIKSGTGHAISFKNGINNFLSIMWDLFALIQYKAGLENTIIKYGTGIIIPAEMDGETFLLKLRKCI